MSIQKNVSSMVLARALACSNVAVAAPVFLVQLGSHGTKEDANSQWRKLSDEFSAELSTLDFQSAEVVLPPAGRKVYRLQAGPLSSRLDALSLCSTIHESGNDCFVVESATFAPEVRYAQPESTSTPLLGAVASLVDEGIDTIDRGASLNEKLPATLMAGSTVSDMAVESVESAAGTAMPWESAFWSSGSSVEEEVNTSVDVADDARIIVAQATNEVPAQLELSAKVEPVVQPMLRAKTLERRDASPVLATALQRPEVYALPTSAQAGDRGVKERLRRAASREVVLRRSPKAPVVANGLVHDQYRPTQTVSLRAPSRLEAVAVAAPLAVSASGNQGAHVEVAEAIPVPLSDDVVTRQPVPKKRLFTGRRARGWGATPSKSFIQKTLWAKVQYFADKQSAMQFWNQFSRQNSQVTRGLRARVTKPYRQRHMSERVSLQLGPFLKAVDIRGVCGLIQNPALECVASRDTGAAVTANVPRYRPEARGYERRNAVAKPRSSAHGYWVQLGSFQTKASAYQEWNRLKSRHPYSLEMKRPTVSQPHLSSSPRPLYRLRTGPFSIRTAAQQLCDGLRNGRSRCVVISE